MAPSSIPANPTQWHAAAREANLENTSLGSMDEHRAFSGSTMPHAAFLQLRAIWPHRLPSIAAMQNLQCGGFFDRNDLHLAERIIEHKAGTKGALEAFIKEISSPSTPNPRPGGDGANDPDEEEAFSDDVLGPFLPILSLWKLLRSPGPASPALQATPAVIFSSHNEFGRDIAKLDYAKPAVGSCEIECEDETNLVALPSPDLLETPSKSRQDDPLMGCLAAIRALSLQDDAAIGKPPTPQPPSQDDPPYARQTAFARSRTSYETQTSTFFTAFFHALYAYTLSRISSSCIQVRPEEVPYTFGKGRGNRESGRRNGLFVACPDGAFYSTNNPSRKGSPFAFFELKPLPRASAQQRILREETAETVAILSHDLRGGKLRVRRAGDNPLPSSSLGHDEARPDLDKHHRLMISLDKDEFWLIHASFTDKYLTYITDMEQTTLPALHLGDDEFIEFRTYGPLRIGMRDELGCFCAIAIALALHQLKTSDIGRSLLLRLERGPELAG
ncbi:uncharacterized protein GLRG_11768 [Colletotrichum graminicola M1.001]|uniref:Uncharacterized protein n=1 Tax=Colletotrichum graminicola (strain M1.001 / M2 / FGSC 10212) TaxID=645133 RepID=E3R0I5_COLGM|nr:uncharacterized protein GLRG_11768 [Colletotrichum graminicola M1.001]EFQ36623.1 hypothetical protein GLRG_11768 [Colletotrichum graminicola M1.001]